MDTTTLNVARLDPPLRVHVSGETAADGDHWASMTAADDHLRGTLDSMAAMLRLSDGVATREDRESLEIDAESDGMDAALEVLEAMVLEIRSARWDPAGYDCGYVAAEHERNGAPARLVVILGTGGPHVELRADFDFRGECERVQLARYWGGASIADTADPRACDLVAAWARTFVFIDC